MKNCYIQAVSVFCMTVEVVATNVVNYPLFTLKIDPHYAKEYRELFKKWKEELKAVPEGADFDEGYPVITENELLELIIFSKNVDTDF